MLSKLFLSTCIAFSILSTVTLFRVSQAKTSYANNSLPLRILMILRIIPLQGGNKFAWRLHKSYKDKSFQDFAYFWEPMIFLL